MVLALSISGWSGEIGEIVDVALLGVQGSAVA